MIELTESGVLVAATVLGVTHGFEPDHAAGISALTTDTDGWTHATFVGGSFAVGHVVVVLAWIGILAIIGRTTASPPLMLDVAISVLPGVVLVAVACTLAMTGARRLRGRSPHPATASSAGPVGRTVSMAHTYLHHSHEGRLGYLRTGIIGSLFALSPPVSMLALVTTVVPADGLRGALGAVAVYAIAITMTMSLVGSGIGEVVALLRGRGRKMHATFELATSVLVFWFAFQLLR